MYVWMFTIHTQLHTHLKFKPHALTIREPSWRQKIHYIRRCRLYITEVNATTAEVGIMLWQSTHEINVTMTTCIMEHDIVAFKSTFSRLGRVHKDRFAVQLAKRTENRCRRGGRIIRGDSEPAWPRATQSGHFNQKAWYGTSSLSLVFRPLSSVHNTTILGVLAGFRNSNIIMYRRRG